MESIDAVVAAAGSGRLGALRLLLQHMHDGIDGPLLPAEAFSAVFERGDLDVLRLLLRYAVPPGPYTFLDALSTWLANTPADGKRLVQAARLVARGWWDELAEELFPLHPPLEEVAGRQPWAVWAAVRELLPPDAQDMEGAACDAASSGCEATLEALVGMGVLQEHGAGLARQWYVDAAANGDRGTLECLVRLKVPLGEGVLVGAADRGAPLAALHWLVAQGVPLAEWEKAAIARGLQRGAQPRTARDAWLQGLVGLPAEDGL